MELDLMITVSRIIEEYHIGKEDLKKLICHMIDQAADENGLVDSDACRALYDILLSENFMDQL
jgi:hypothetical protein